MTPGARRRAPGLPKTTTIQVLDFVRFKSALASKPRLLLSSLDPGTDLYLGNVDDNFLMYNRMNKCCGNVVWVFFCKSCKLCGDCFLVSQQGHHSLFFFSFLPFANMGWFKNLNQVFASKFDVRRCYDGGD